jgi:aminomethyltransferase
MGQIRLRGRDARELAQRVFSNDALGLEVGRVRYGLLCQDDGGVIDDVTLYCDADDDLWLCVNAANVAADFAWIREVRGRFGLRCDPVDESDATALLALQGPSALEIAAQLRDPGPAGETVPGRWRCAGTRLAGIPVRLSRTGYTGEDGYEIYAPAARAEALWDRLLEAGGARLRPAGLGARDTLRTEMGYALYGHELDLEHDPLEAGLERFVALGREFIGRDALARARASGPTRRLVGLWVEGRQVARAGFPIHAPGGTGAVTSGTFGPSVERAIAMGYVPAAAAEPGTRLEVEVRGRRVGCEVTRLPFYRRKG